jgi:hypothetical protein
MLWIAVIYSWNQDFLDRGLLLIRKLLNQGFLLVKLKSSLRTFTVATMAWLTVMEYICHKWPRICSTCRKHFPIIYHRVCSRVARWVPLVEQELLTLPGHLSSPPGFSGASITRSLALCIGFVDRCLSFCTFSFGHRVVCSSSIYGFWLPLRYLQTLLLVWVQYKKSKVNIYTYSYLRFRYITAETVIGFCE